VQIHYEELSCVIQRLCLLHSIGGEETHSEARRKGLGLLRGSRMIPSRNGNRAFTPSAQPVQGGIQMRSRIWMLIAAAALVAFAVISIKKQRERAEAERMMVWG